MDKRKIRKLRRKKIKDEIWKDISGYQGLYQISNYGRVRSFKQAKMGRIISPGKNNIGYMTIGLCNCSGERKSLYVHRLVAEAFLEKVKGKSFIDHIDRDKMNNHVSNLRWCTHEENCNNRS